jgi:hypothetical protein
MTLSKHPKTLPRATGGGVVRVVAVLLFATLAGCTATDTGPTLFGQCPQWAQAPGEHHGSYDGGAGTQVLAPQNLTYLGRPFDMVRLRIDAFTANGTVELRAYALENGTRGVQRNWRDFRPVEPRSVPVLVLDAAAVGHEFETALTSIAQEDHAHPGPVQLAWAPASGNVHVGYAVTYFYKVCGLSA